MKARLLILVSLSLVSAAIPGAAFAHHSSAQGQGRVGDKKPEFNEQRVPPRIEKALGGEVTAAPGGGYRVDVARGPDMFTHGPDPVTPALSGGKAPENDPFDHASHARFGGEPERTPVCAASAIGDHYQRVIYMRPTGSTDRYATMKPEIQEEIRQMNFTLNRDSVASGGPTADYKVLCDGGGIQVDHVVSPAPHTYSGVSSALRNLGYNKQNVDYTVFYDGQPEVSQCGVATFWFDNEQLDANNPNNRGNAFGIAWFDCWDGTTAQHENGHNQGAVGPSAPHSTGDGTHCFDHFDVMCYNDGGSLDPGPPLFTDHCPAGTRLFDCGFNTYFDSATEPGEYLASHWNIGSSLNRFVAFNAAGGGDQPPNAAFVWNCPNLTCQFTDNSFEPGGTIASRSWDFDDGDTSTLQNPSHTFPSSGTYNVRLSVTDDDGGTDFYQVPVSVNDGTVPKLQSGVPVNTTAGSQGDFDRFKVKVPRSAKKVTIKTTGEDCSFVSDALCLPDLDLYVAIGFPPDLDNWHCRPLEYGITEACGKRRPGIRGTHNIAVHNYAAEPGTPYTIRATIKR